MRIKSNKLNEFMCGLKALCYFSTVVSIVVSLYSWKDVDDRTARIVGIIAFILLVGLLCHIVSTTIKDRVNEKLRTSDNKIKKCSSYIIFFIGSVVYCSIAYLSYLFYQYYHIESLFVRKSYPYIIVVLGVYSFFVISKYVGDENDK